MFHLQPLINDKLKFGYAVVVLFGKMSITFVFNHSLDRRKMLHVMIP